MRKEVLVIDDHDGDDPTGKAIIRKEFLCPSCFKKIKVIYQDQCACGVKLDWKGFNE